MKTAARLLLILLLPALLLLPAVPARAQENQQVYLQGRRYLDLNLKSMNRYAKRMERSQAQMLRRLKRKEEHLAKRLLHTDSAAYLRLKSRPLSFDSIWNLSRLRDTASRLGKSSKGAKKAVDSLKAVYVFVQAKSGSLTENKYVRKAASLSGYEQQLSSLQQRLAYNEQITELSNQHALDLQGIAGKVAGTTGIQKELFYGKSKLKEWKKLADDPSLAEEKALEYLQGTKGFDLSMKQSLNGDPSGGAGVAGATSAEEMEKLGFQTKRLVSASLQQAFGDKLTSVQGKMGQQIGEWKDKSSKLQAQFKGSKQSLATLKATEKPVFRINPIRGKPFWLRLEKSYAFNTSRSSTLSDGTKRPALLSLAANVAYKHTSKLNTGIGLAGDVGLGQNWSAIRFTFEGIGIRSFVSWEWQYGIAAYAGFERTWKQYAFQQNSEGSTSMNYGKHTNKNYSDAVLLGIGKKYKVNSKWNGQIQLLYDVWWADKGLRSPIVLRFINTK